MHVQHTLTVRRHCESGLWYFTVSVLWHSRASWPITTGETIDGEWSDADTDARIVNIIIVVLFSIITISNSNSNSQAYRYLRTNSSRLEIRGHPNAQSNSQWNAQSNPQSNAQSNDSCEWRNMMWTYPKHPWCDSDVLWEIEKSYFVTELLWNHRMHGSRYLFYE